MTNASLPDLKNLLRIAKALSVDVARLLNIEVVIDDGVSSQCAKPISCKGNAGDMIRSGKGHDMLQLITSDNMLLSEKEEE